MLECTICKRRELRRLRRILGSSHGLDASCELRQWGYHFGLAKSPYYCGTWQGLSRGQIESDPASSQIIQLWKRRWNSADSLQRPPRNSPGSGMAWSLPDWIRSCCWFQIGLRCWEWLCRRLQTPQTTLQGFCWLRGPARRCWQGRQCASLSCWWRAGALRASGRCQQRHTTRKKCEYWE